MPTFQYPNMTRGTTFEYSIDNGSTWTPIPKCTNVSPPKQKRGKIEDTTLDSVNDTKEYAPGWRDPGEVQFKARMNKGIYATLKGLFDNATPLKFRVKLPLYANEVTPTTIVFSGWLSEFGLEEISADDTNKAVMAGTAVVTGDYTYTQGS